MAKAISLILVLLLGMPKARFWENLVVEVDSRSTIVRIIEMGWPHILAKARSTFREVRFWVEDVPAMAVLAMKAECPILVALD
ncbi:hypothetical protein Gotur_023686 [Gossypium turneri]